MYIIYVWSVDDDDGLMLDHASSSEQHSRRCSKRRISSLSATKSRSVMLSASDVNDWYAIYIYVCELCTVCEVYCIVLCRREWPLTQRPVWQSMISAEARSVRPNAHWHQSFVSGKIDTSAIDYITNYQSHSLMSISAIASHSNLRRVAAKRQAYSSSAELSK